MSLTPDAEVEHGLDHEVDHELQHLRYPVGDYVHPAVAPDAVALAAFVETLRGLPKAMAAAVEGLNESQLDTPYRPDGWTVRQLVHHVADSHANAYIRVKLALTEDWPQIRPYDQAAWARLWDSSLPIDVSLEWLTGLHRRWLAVFNSLSDEQWDRGYVHPDIGRLSLRFVVPLYAWHSRHHTAHIVNLRKRMGW